MSTTCATRECLIENIKHNQIVCSFFFMPKSLMVWWWIMGLVFLYIYRALAGFAHSTLWFGYICSCKDGLSVCLCVSQSTWSHRIRIYNSLGVFPVLTLSIDAICANSKCFNWICVDGEIVYSVNILEKSDSFGKNTIVCIEIIYRNELYYNSMPIHVFQ